LASVQVIQGPDKGRVYELIDGENIIGRSECKVDLGDGTVSRRHCRLIPRDGRWTLEDLGSANGTYLNGVKLRMGQAVKRGDQIRCGSSLLVFEGEQSVVRGTVDVDEEGNLVDAAIVATIPSNEDSVIIPTPEAGAQAIGNLRIIYDLISEISSTFSVDELLNRVLDKVFSVLEGDRGYVMLIDENGTLTLQAARLAGDEATTMEQAPISRTIINEVIQKEVGVLSSNAMTDKRFASGKSVHDFGIRSAICVPIKGRERILGVIQVDCGVSSHTYSTEQLRLLTAIGFQAGLAIENVRLYESKLQSERLAAVGETVAHLSHHIKNILQALSAGIDVVEMCLNKDNLDRARESWPVVQRNLERINQLILNMLAFSKDREPLLESVNVSSIVDDCVELLTPQADERNVAILAALDEIPPVPVDASGLSQAVLNLLNNALDAVEDDTGAITVSTDFDSQTREVIVKVADNGRGISEDQIDHIFNAFYSNKGQKGTGLGLAVTKKIVDELHGRIDVDSTPGEGTTFTIRLPADQPGDPHQTTGPGI
jgi:signal transduction histidine kinase/pSer/pThr/pTyr-binding forkhead associated (FHA) protein